MRKPCGEEAMTKIQCGYPLTRDFLDYGFDFSSLSVSVIRFFKDSTVEERDRAEILMEIQDQNSPGSGREYKQTDGQRRMTMQAILQEI
ncbi:hypothetical protein Bca52824_019450 [Brassica carinata]|uniref:Uncharacterized protein n=1 Tax=Brassica carinata TaxID=52824 RepID=A0A8X8AZP7_BRACI|nr:hypothetical protein Bca52824_019450 [Brassica carinata]